MAICPNCREEIRFLIFSAKVEQIGIYQADIQNENNWDTRAQGNWSDLRFTCPKCNIVLFVNEENAKKFLKSAVKLEDKLNIN
jgi:hypothetical protein